MRSEAGFTRADALAVALVLIVAPVLLAGSIATTHARSSRSICAANLSGMYKAMYTYSVTSKDKFPTFGKGDPAGDVFGFRYTDRAKNRAETDDPKLISSASASLWVLVRDGSVGTGQYVCPNSGDTQDQLESEPGKAAMLDSTFDFYSPDNLSYSTANMYGSRQKRFWGSAVPADYILMGDDNNAEGDAGGRLHDTTTADKADRATIARRENSLNHGSSGQNVQRGDGSVVFADDPYGARSKDNFNAADTAGGNDAERAAPPFLANKQDDVMKRPDPARDSMLIPVTGNKGVSLSGKPPVKPAAKPAPDAAGDGK